MKKKLKTYQIWQCTGETYSCVSFGEKHPKAKEQAAMGCDERDEPILIGEIKAYDWNEAMTKYHKFMGWEPYVPMDEELDYTDE